MLRAKAIDVDVKRGDYDVARQTISRINPTSQSEIDYLMSQMTYLDYLSQQELFVLTSSEYDRLRAVAETHDPLAPYTRGVLSLLTGEIIRPEIPEIPKMVDKREYVVEEVMTTMVRPNPFSDEIAIHIPDGESATVAIHRLDGTLVYYEEKVIGNVLIPTQQWQVGVYLVTLTDVEGRQEYQKLIKQ